MSWCTVNSRKLRIVFNNVMEVDDKYIQEPTDPLTLLHIIKHYYASSTPRRC